jgi:recombination DNA repair RAD52 pathway protein
MSETDDTITEIDAPLTKDQVGALMSPLNPKRVQSRQQSGRSLSYLAAYEVKAALIRIFGFGGFSAETIDTNVVSVEQVDRTPEGIPTGNYRAVAVCTVRLSIPILGAVYTESASSSQVNPQPGEALDFAIKTAESDALKRAATYLGTQFGLGLYDNGSTQDVVRTLVEPTQAALLAEYRSGREEVVDAAAQALVDRAIRSGKAGQ